MSSTLPILEVRDLTSGYGQRTVFSGLHLTVQEKDIYLLLGHNGAGKTTLLRTIVGLMRPVAGKICFRGKEITGREPKANVADGMAFVPQGHAIFRRLTVNENLALGAFSVADKALLPRRLEAVRDLFPILGERSTQIAGTLSGGQQQMLALGMALMVAPRLLILDEPSIGLAPNLVSAVMESIVKIRVTLGATILIVEQNVEKSLPIATEVMIMRTGQTVYRGPPHGLSERASLIKYF
jgi:branched-chain amino acid transport system ATP-binding protein